MTRIHLIPVLSDNYSYVIEHDGQCAVVDPGAAQPVIAYLDGRNLTPGAILLTHHHGDHTGGAQAIKRRYGAAIVAPAEVSGADRTVCGDDAVAIGSLTGAVIATPGHTKGHVAFYFPAAQTVFTGDTLFSLGCGRLFEDKAQAMWQSLQKLAALPPETLIYCGHEYTESNGLFALEADPDNGDLLRRMDEVRMLRRQGQSTIPVTLDTELRTNPFLRCTDAARFAQLRRLKDSF